MLGVAGMAKPLVWLADDERHQWPITQTSHDGFQKTTMFEMCNKARFETGAELEVEVEVVFKVEVGVVVNRLHVAGTSRRQRPCTIQSLNARH